MLGKGLRTKVALLALLCAVLPSLLISLLAFTSARETLQRAVQTELSDLAETQMQQLQALLARADTDLGTWSALHTMQNVLIDDEDGTIAAELDRLHQRYPRFGDLLVVNPKGIVVAATLAGNVGADLKQKDFFQPALWGSHYRGGVYHQELLGGEGIVLAYPIRADYDRDTIIGLVVGVLDWSKVQADLSSVSIWGSAQDADHRLVLQDGSGRTLFGHPAVGEGSDALPLAAGVESISGPTSSFLAATRADAQSGWLMHAMISEAVAYADVTALGQNIAILSSAIILAAVLLGAVVSGKSIVAPISAVTAAMTRISRGQTDVDLDGRDRPDEIGQMLSAIGIFRTNMERDNALLQQRELELLTQNHRFDSALRNMSQGLTMFDRDGRLTVCNPQFAALYELPPSLAQPGGRLVNMLAHLVSAGACTAEAAESYNIDALGKAQRGEAWDQLFRMSSGRLIAIAHRPMGGGGWVATHADITERQRAEELITHMARHDALTGLPNRVLFRTEIDEALQQAGNAGGIAVLCLDLDRFKSVNDTLGHPVGDALLRQVALRLRETAGENVVAARLGGDEFALVQRGVAQPEGGRVLAEKLIASLSEPYDLDDHHIVIGASVGIAIAPRDGTDPDTLLKNADLALYRGKAEGGGTHRLFAPEMDESMQVRRALELDLRRALANGEFRLDYQPLVNLASDQIIGFEALLRWHHPEKGIVGPGTFIPIAEETGLIVPIGEWVLRQACADATTWPPHVRVAVNLSPVQFRNPNLVLTVFNALAGSHLSATRLDLEITETVLLNDSDATLATLHQLRDLGVRISMDDFGTGYSSLSYLQKFPFSKIKIDQSFIRGLGNGEEALAIIRAVTGMGRSLGMITTAEGVETLEQFTMLRQEGCTEIQGYYVSRPCTLSEATALLTAGELKAAG